LQPNLKEYFRLFRLKKATDQSRCGFMGRTTPPSNCGYFTMGGGLKRSRGRPMCLPCLLTCVTWYGVIWCGVIARPAKQAVAISTSSFVIPCSIPVLSNVEGFIWGSQLPRRALSLYLTPAILTLSGVVGYCGVV